MHWAHGSELGRTRHTLGTRDALVHEMATIWTDGDRWRTAWWNRGRNGCLRGQNRERGDAWNELGVAWACTRTHCSRSRTGGCKVVHGGDGQGNRTARRTENTGAAPRI